MSGVDHPFAIVPLGLVTDENLPTGAVKTYAVLAERANSDGLCWPGIDVIAEQIHMSGRTVRRCIQGLEQAGWVEVQRRNHGMIQQTSVYRINRVCAKTSTDPIGHDSPMVLATTVQADRTPLSPSHRTPLSVGEQDPIEQDPIDSTKDSPVTPAQSNHPVMDEIKAFDAWWQRWPRKEHKKLAATAYANQIKLGATAGQLDAGLSRYLESRMLADGCRYHAENWLHKELWRDEPEPATASEPGPRQPPAYTPDPTPPDPTGSADAVRRLRQKATV